MKHLALLALLLAIPLVSASHLGNSTIAEAGNVTELTIFPRANQTTKWQGFAGQVFFGTNASSPSILNATGGLVNATNMFFQIDCDDPVSATGFILISNSSTTPAGLTAGNLTQLNAFVGTGDDTASATFTTTSTFALSTGTVTGVPTVFTFINESGQIDDFREGYLNQGNNLVFAVVIEKDLHGYNRSFFDYQAILPAPNQTVSYFIFGDITFTCPAPAVVGGGGSAGRGYWPAIIIRKREEPEVPVRIERPEEIETLLRRLNLSLISRALSPLMPAAIEGLITNTNEVGIDSVRLEIMTPSVLFLPMNAHPYAQLFWSLRLGGWSSHGVPEPRPRAWKLSDIPYFDVVPPQSVTPFTFTVVPPLMLPGLIDIGAFAYSGETRIASTSEQFEVVTPGFAVYPEWVNERVLTLYHVVDNRGKPGKSINIEVALNRARTTLIGEVIGPLDVPADRVAVFGYEYKLSRKALTADTVDVRLLSKGETIHATHSLR